MVCNNGALYQAAYRAVTEVIKTICTKLYRVSIKSFPYYKPLLPENYVEYKYIFLPLLIS
jgi:hypothetical protein